MKSTAMRKPNLFAVLSLFLLLTASITWAQTISSQKGLTTAEFNLPQGKIKLYLPDDIRPGDHISGRIVTEPAGKNAKQIEKNLGELTKYSIGLDNEKFQVNKDKETFQFIVRTDRQLQGPIELLNVSGIKTAELIIPETKERKLVSAECMIPSHAMTGSPLRITGPFDGNSDNTKCAIDNTAATILAESPRQCIISYPADAGGMHTINIQEINKQPCTRPVSGVQMDVSAGKLNLKKGERTFIDVKIRGLQNLPDTAVLTLINLSSDVVAMLPTNNVIIPLSPDSVGSGTFAKRFDIQSLRTGSFIVNVNLDLPETTTGTNGRNNTQSSCGCIADVSISLSASKAGEKTFTATINAAECKGAYGSGVNTFVQCAVLKKELKWTISNGKENADIVGGASGSSVTIKEKNDKPYTVKVTLIVTCTGGTTCEDSDEMDQSGENISRCECKADCAITEVETKGSIVIFKGDVKAECKGVSGRGSTKAACGVKSITYKWSIGKSGEDVAEVSGPDDGPDVNVKIKKDGSYNLYLNGNVTCRDGSTCDFVCSLEKTAHPPTTTECGLRYEWCAGPAIKLISHGYYPSDPKILKQYRPGDLIGLSVLAEDFDILLQRCLCPEGLSIKQHPPTPDKLEYDWKLTNFEDGHGNLIMHSGGESNSVLYQLPYCFQQFPVTDKITVTIKNSGGKAIDDSIQVLFTIRVFIPPSKYKEQYVVERSLDIKVTETILHTPSDVVCEKDTDGDCVVQPLKWEEGSKLMRTAKTDIRRPADRPPDNIMVLHVNASDNDDVTLTCFHKKTGLTITEKMVGVYDDCIYTWTVIKGSGSFPLGNHGASVVFKHDYGEGNEVTVQCMITDSKLQFPDIDPPPVDVSIEPRIKPVALVGVGSLLYLGMKDAHGELFVAGKIAMKNYEKAGYKVDFQAETTSGKIEPAFKNNAYQAIMLLGHGNDMGFIGADGVSFNPSDVGSWTYDKWKCSTTLEYNRQPLIQELILLGCNMGKAYWFRNFFSLENYYVRYEWVWSSAFFSSVKKYVEKQHKPLPPRIVDP